jgi:cytochrome c
MVTRNLLLILSAGLLYAGSALAEDGAALAQKANCTAFCHAVDKKKVGPAFKDVAAKYKDDKEAAAKLEKKVRSGGGGVWGGMPMPATANSVSDGDIKQIVEWVLSLK